MHTAKSTRVSEEMHCVETFSNASPELSDKPVM